MKDTYEALLIGLLSRLLVIVVVILASLLIVPTGNIVASHSSLPVISLFDRWDSAYYVSIAKNGYPLGYPSLSFWTDKHFNAYTSNPPLARPEWAFFPLFPEVIRAFSFPSNSSVNALVAAGFIISNLAFFFSVYFFYKLTNRLFKSPRTAIIATAFFSLWGGSVFYSAVYSESLFMMLVLAAFYYLESDQLPIAALLGFLAAWTRSDGFLIFVPFLIYALQSRKDKPKMQRLLGATFLAASPFLLFQIIGYEVAGKVFPISILSRNLNWQVYPVLWQQFASINPGYTLFFSVGLLLIFLPTISMLVYKLRGSKELGPNREIGLWKYWFFYAAMLVVILFDSNVYSSIRYAIPMLPIYWVSAAIREKNRVAGDVIMWVMAGMMVVGCLLFEARGYFM